MGIFSSSNHEEAAEQDQVNHTVSLPPSVSAWLHTGGLVAHHVDQILDRMEHQEDGADGQQDGKHPFGPAREKVSLPVLI